LPIVLRLAIKSHLTTQSPASSAVRCSRLIPSKQHTAAGYVKAMSASSVAGFARWWTGELRVVLAPTAGTPGARSRCIVLTPQTDLIEAALEERGVLKSLAGWPTPERIPLDALSSALSALRAREKKLPIVVRIPANLVRVRHLALPAAARHDFPRLLTLDLTRSSPLKPTDLYHAHEVTGLAASPGMLAVRQLIFKKRLLEPIARQIEMAGQRISAVECWNEAQTAVLPIAFHPVGEDPPQRPPRRIEMALAALILGLGLATTGLAWLRKEQALAVASETVSNLEARAVEGRRMISFARDAEAEVERVRRVFDSRVSALSAVEEATRLIPDGAWVDELRIEGDTIDLAGLTRSGSALLTVFQASKLFHDVQFTAPVRFEPSEDRERFRLRARLSNTAEAAR
jgi:general secretion pathway protein L